MHTDLMAWLGGEQADLRATVGRSPSEMQMSETTAAHFACVKSRILKCFAFVL